MLVLPYPEYKPVGLPWLDSVPAHWSIKRGKSVFRCIDIRSKAGDEELLTVSAAHGVIPRRTATVTMFKAESYAGYKLCWPDDLVINSLWAWGRGLGVSRHHGIVSSAYGVYRLRDRETVVPAYIDALVRSEPFNWELHVRSKGIWISRLQLTDESFLDAPIPLPPPAEQAGIVRFLGAVDRKVNRFIRAKRRLIEVLTEQKQAIITHAVTKGLNPHAPLKPSGIDWLGDVPEHWEVRKLRFLVDTLGGMTPSKADQSFWNGDVPWVSPKDMKSVEIVGSIDHITQAALAQTNITLIPPPAVLIVVRGMILARTFPVGVTTLPVTINQDMKALRPRNSPVGVNALYLRHLLSGLGDVVKMLIEESGHGTRVLRTDLWRNLPLPVPPRSEQEAICEYISNQTAVFDQAASQARREIDLIREYRTRLVADVVTGKIDVCAAAADLPDEPITAAGEAGSQMGECQEECGGEGDAPESDPENATCQEMET